MNRLARLICRDGLPALSDREAVDALRPFGQGVKAVCAGSPVNRTRRLVSEPEAARGEHAEFEGADFSV